MKIRIISDEKNAEIVKVWSDELKKIGHEVCADDCDICMLVLPSGAVSHLEAGTMIGDGKKLIVWQGGFENDTIEGTYRLADLVTDSPIAVIDFLEAHK